MEGGGYAILWRKILSNPYLFQKNRFNLEISVVDITNCLRREREGEG